MLRFRKETPDRPTSTQIDSGVSSLLSHPISESIYILIAMNCRRLVMCQRCAPIKNSHQRLMGVIHTFDAPLLRRSRRSSSSKFRIDAMEPPLLRRAYRDIEDSMHALVICIASIVKSTVFRAFDGSTTLTDEDFEHPMIIDQALKVYMKRS